MTGDRVAAARAGLDRTVAQVLTAIGDEADLDRTFAEATELIEVIRGYLTPAGELRARLILRMYEESKSYAKLAKRTSMSRARAAELVSSARPGAGTDIEAMPADAR